MDTITKTHLEWAEEDCYPSEPKFVASPGAVDEDDGKHTVYSTNIFYKSNAFKLKFKLCIKGETWFLFRCHLVICGLRKSQKVTLLVGAGCKDVQRDRSCLS